MLLRRLTGLLRRRLRLATVFLLLRVAVARRLVVRRRVRLRVVRFRTVVRRFVVRRLVILRLRARAPLRPAERRFDAFAFLARRALASARNCAAVARLRLFRRTAMRPPFFLGFTIHSIYS